MNTQGVFCSRPGKDQTFDESAAGWRRWGGLGKPADSGIWGDWERAVAKAMTEGKAGSLELKQDNPE